VSLRLSLFRKLSHLQSTLHLWVALSLAAIFGVVFLFGEWRAVQRDREELLHDLVVAQRESSNRLVETREYLSLIGDELIRGTLVESGFDERARSLLEHHPELLSITWYPPEGRAAWQVSFEAMSPGNLESLQNTLAAARGEGRFTISPLFRTWSGEKCLALVLPMQKGPDAPALLAIVSLARLIRFAMPPWIDQRYDLSVVDGSGHIVMREASRRPLDASQWALSASIMAPLDVKIRLQRYRERLDWQAFLLVALSIGVILGVALTMRELNADRKLKRETAANMQKAKELAESANHAKTTFLANVSHELRTPLTAILGYIDLLRRDLPSPPDLDKHLHSIERNGRQLLLLINDLLDMSRIEAGFLSIRKEQVHVPDFLTDILLTFVPSARSNQIEMSTSTVGRVPLHIEVDPLRLKQILSNLISNALKFTPQGEILLRVRFEAPDHLLLEVADTGLGIPKIEQERLFQTFPEDSVGPYRHLKGAGLGLALSRRLARLMGGELELVTSAVGRGSVFCCRLPISAPPADEVEAWFDMQKIEAPLPPPDRIVPVSPTLFSEQHVLLIEDSLDNQALLREYLRRAGAQTTIVGSGEEGLERVKDSNFDLILLDVQLPGLDGYETCRTLRSQGIHTPVVILTAHAGNDTLERCLDCGAQAHVPKPFNTDTLFETLSRILNPDPKTSRPISNSKQSDLNRRLCQDPQLRPIVMEFVRHLPRRLEDIDGAMREGQTLKVSRLAHSLQGTAGNFGYPELAKKASELEQKALEPGSFRDCLTLREELGRIVDDIQHHSALDLE
jgi:signal transduction histidine kinase/CheY-like chemotaxis protein/HPt (histidine-containing phosphotransfer) domain-containing protein